MWPRFSAPTGYPGNRVPAVPAFGHTAGSRHWVLRVALWRCPVHGKVSIGTRPPGPAAASSTQADRSVPSVSVSHVCRSSSDLARHSRSTVTVQTRSGNCAERTIGPSRLSWCSWCSWCKCASTAASFAELRLPPDVILVDGGA
jgi:hypothetical protein